MKNVTVSLDDATYRNARRRAAEDGRSLSAMVREFLQKYGAQESEFDRLARQEREIRAKMLNDGVGFDTSQMMSREELYDPDRVREERRAAWR